jgi:hypothetical protein
LQLGEHAARGEEQGGDADDRGEGAGGLVGGALDHRLHRFGALPADEAFQLVGDGALHRLLAEEEAGDGGGDQQQRGRWRRSCSRRWRRRGSWRRRR